MSKINTKNYISINEIDILVFDFDGVLTDNKVHIDKNGSEFVSCTRSDGIGSAAIEKLNKPTLILSTEKNLVVTARAKKSNVPKIQGTDSKVKALENILNRNNYDF